MNGEQHDKGYSKFKYRPFTLEGNFAFASAIQEMLIQSHTGIVHIFPAIPKDWQEASFDKLRTEGAFLVSADKKKGNVQLIKIYSEKGGTIKIKNPFASNSLNINANHVIDAGTIIIETEVGQKIIIEGKD